MAATQYHIYCRYFNGNINKCVTNASKVTWVSKSDMEDLTAFYNTNKTKYQNIIKDVANGIKRLYELSIEESEIYTKCVKYESLISAKNKNMLSEEICFIEPGDDLYATTPAQQVSLKQAKVARDLANLDIIGNETNLSNPKYDMLFMYAGIAKEVGQANLHQAPSSSGANPKQAPYIYYDKMARIEYDVWFLYSIHASLKSAMIKAKELINVVGKDSIKVVKNVPLDKYIEIV